jgi:hypothetical protein
MSDYNNPLNTILKYEEKRIIYGLSEDDLKNVSESKTNIFKDFALGSLGITIPCILNAISAYVGNKGWEFNSLLNTFTSISSGSICIFCFVFALITHKKDKSILIEIQNRKSVIIEKTKTVSEASAGSAIMQASGK